MKTRNIAACLITMIFTLSLVIMQIHAQSLQSSTASQPVTSFGTIIYPSTFVYRGTNIGMNNILSGYAYTSYIPNIFGIFQDLGINTVTLVGGTEGGNAFNLQSNPDWAQNLDNFLSICDSHGIKVIFNNLGRPAYPTQVFFGIHHNLAINTAKSMVDQLGGNNALNHNFLTDSRIAFWIIDNEPTLSDSTVFNWLCQMGDYMMSKGAKVACVGGYFADYGDNAYWIRQFAGHQNFIVTHHYNLGITSTAQANGNVYSACYNMFMQQINVEIAARGNIPLTNFFFGEAGLGHEPNFVEMGNVYHFTEETRGEYYRALFQACKDAGIGGVAPYLLFDAYLYDSGDVEPWGAITWNGTLYFTNVTAQYKAYYLP